MKSQICRATYFQALSKEAMGLADEQISSQAKERLNDTSINWLNIVDKPRVVLTAESKTDFSCSFIQEKMEFRVSYS